MHARIALALEQVATSEQPRLAELALHWRLANAPDAPRKAANYSRRAGHAALAGLAPAEAARLFGIAVELLKERIPRSAVRRWLAFLVSRSGSSRTSRIAPPCSRQPSSRRTSAAPNSPPAPRSPTLLVPTASSGKSTTSACRRSSERSKIDNQPSTQHVGQIARARGAGAQLGPRRPASARARQ